MFQGFFRLLFGNEVAAVSDLEDLQIGRLSLKGRLQPDVTGAAERQNRHLEFGVVAIIDDVLWKGLIPGVAGADCIAARVSVA